MRIFLNVAALNILLCLFFLSACQESETPPPPQKTGVVVANQSYQENFGTPPQGKSGQAFARVGYLPLREAPEKLQIFPLFLFSEKEQLRQIIERLISGELLLLRTSDLFSPFPDDLEISVMSPEGPTTTLFLTTQQSWSLTDQTAGGRALAEAALQFENVARVVILSNGVPLAQMPGEGYQHNPELVVEVKPPRLVMIAGVWEDGSALLTEIMVEFDRPIKVNSFKLYDQADQVVDGDYFTSIFQMAVVVHPKEANLFQEATLLRAEWDVVDDKGRANRGTDRLPMLRIDH